MVAAELEATWPARARALRACGRAAIRIDCGACATPHLMPFRCHTRTCPHAQRAGAARMGERLIRRVELHDQVMAALPWDGPGRGKRRSWRFITLTMPVPDDGSAWAPRELARRVRRVRSAASAWWKRTPWGKQRHLKGEDGKWRKRSRTDTSAIVAIEVGATRGMVHAHVAVYGEYLPQEEIERHWQAALGVQAIAHVKAVRNSRVLREIVKYACGFGKDGGFTPAKAAAVEIGFRHVHRISVLGALRGIKTPDSAGVTEDLAAEDLHDTTTASCEACGTIGEWRWRHLVTPQEVERNGGFGLVTDSCIVWESSRRRRGGPDVPAHRGAGNVDDAQRDVVGLLADAVAPARPGLDSAGVGGPATGALRDHAELALLF